MSIESNGYLGKDGKRYNSMWELDNANKVVEEQEKQTKLLEMQAKLETVKMQQEKELEYERQEHEKELEYERQEHEKEMRLLKIFDDLSIPLSTFQKFETDLFNDNNSGIDENDLQKEQEVAMKMLQNSKDQLADIQKVLKIQEDNADFIQKNVKYSPEYKKFEDFVNGKLSLQRLKQDDINQLNHSEEIEELFKKAKKEDNILQFTVVVFIISIAMIFVLYDLMALWLLLGMGSFFYGIALLANVQNLKKALNATVNLQMYEDVQSTYTWQLKNIKDEYEEIVKKNNVIRNANLNKKLQYIYEFRKNHYNLQIEKLFIDSGLIDKCMKKEVIFKTIDKKDIIKDGTYEDYFLFFSNFSSNYQEYENSLQGHII